MTDFTPNTTTDGNEWDVNGGPGSATVELTFTYVVGPASYHTAEGYMFLSREDLVAMLAAIDEGSA